MRAAIQPGNSDITRLVPCSLLYVMSVCVLLVLTAVSIAANTRSDKSSICANPLRVVILPLVTSVDFSA